MSITASTVASLMSPNLAKKVLEPIASKVGGEVARLSKEKWRKYTHSFERYLREAENKHKYFSSQVFANEGQLLEDFYIPLTLGKASSTGRKANVVVAEYPSDLIAAYKDILIVDTAGMGKSTLLKFIFLQSLKVAEAIPIFIELRKLSKERSIWSFLLAELALGSDEIGTKILEQCLREGVFTFFLDGFDEIPDDDKRTVSDQIIALKSIAERNRFILSSREEQSLAYLAEFHKFSIKPLSKEEAFHLIRKISPEAKIAESLIDKIEQQPQESLKEFLTNPLLVSLLVKSFLHSPILPVRLSEFYRQVFDALFQNHDAKKELGGFARKKRSGLDLDRFHKALRALGVLTYKDSKLEFSTDALIAQIERVKELTSDSNYSASSLHHDLLHAVPLFLQEGSLSRWAHRSLQEYFAAAYVCIDAKEDQIKNLQQLYVAGVSKNANLLRLCADIDSKTFKHTLVKRYLSERLGMAERSFSQDNFPEIDPLLLAERKAIIHDPQLSLFMLPRSMEVSAAREYLQKYPEIQPHLFISVTPQGKITLSPDFKVKYFVKVLENKYSTMDSIIRTYFQENILLRPDEKPLRSGFRKVPNCTELIFNDDPRNPLNSKENFRNATQLLSNISRYLFAIYDLPRMKNLHANVLRHEVRSTSLTINFE